MKFAFYPKLALSGIRKNRRLYYPYILTCVGMVMMFYIIHYLAAMPALSTMRGGRTATTMLGFGVWVMAIFSLIFLFYTNSFLMRRRTREFGLYNILGMGKAHLSRMLLWETAILFLLSMALGLLGGIGLSKLAELCLTRVLRGEVSYRFSVSRDALVDTLFIFAFIFGLVYLKSLAQLWRLSAISLLRSENVGEKPPRANYLLGIGGVLVLAAAYYIAVSIQSPLKALVWFFIAVVMVIVATYLIFIAGSVMLCRLLQKNKRYYYQKNHFVSVSSMAYRMKRNGAGLASICILSTMVLVTMLASTSLYFGAEDSLRTQYPFDINLSADYIRGDSENDYSPEKADALIGKIDEEISRFGVQPKNVQRYLSTAIPALLKDGKLITDQAAVDRLDLDACIVRFLPLEDYNRNMGTQETLESHQVLLHCSRQSYNGTTITLPDGTVLDVKKQVERMMTNADASLDVLPTFFLVVNDLESVLPSLGVDAFDEYESHYIFRYELSYGFDLDAPESEQIALTDALYDAFRDWDILGEFESYSYSVNSRAAQRGEFYGLYGGIFFLGIFLSIVFLAATVLIIYYKQISEGYEDQSRFEIMQKVGMTTKDIRKSINSQMLTVFALPLLTAILHLSFSFPILQKLLMLFNLQNTLLMLLVMVGSALVFGVIYAIIYKITSRAYLHIVSGGKNE